MKDFLIVLFYQAIVAVNTAVIIGGIVWLAKRKDEKDGRKPNPDFTPPPEKKPEVELRSALIKTANGEKIAQRWYSPDEQIPQYAILQGEPYKFLAEMDKDGGKLVEFVRIKPPTTGTNVIEPKPHGYYLTMTTYDAKDYGETHTFNGEEYERTMVAQSADGEAISMIYRRKYPQPIQSFIGEVRGGPGNEVMGTVTAKSAEELEEKLEAFNLCETCRWSDDMGYCHNEKLCNPEKRPYFAARKINPNQPFCWYWEQALRVDNNGKKTPARISIAKSKERNAFGVDTETAAKIAKAAAGNAGASALDEIVEKINAIGEVNVASLDEIKKAVQAKQITPDEAKKPPCKECRFYVSDEQRDKCGFCGKNDETVGAYDRKGCFEQKEALKEPCCENCAYLSTLGGDNICANTGLRVSLRLRGGHCGAYKPSANKRPAPIGTVTVGGKRP